MMYRASSETATWQFFWYEKNLQGDVVAVYDNNGVKHVSYTYDAWGNTTETRHVNYTAASYNPFRYRGYYYDSDISLYCLGTRWYSTQFRRFLSPDDISYLGANGDLNSYNLYAYCSNNPVMYVDPTGHSIIGGTILLSMFLGALIGVGVKYIPDLAEAVTTDGFQWQDFIDPITGNWQEYTIAALEGMVTGFAYGLGLGLGANAFSLGVRISASAGITAFLGTTLGSTIAGMGIYVLETNVFKLTSFENSELWQAGLHLGIKSAMNFGMGLLLGNQGFYKGLDEYKSILKGVIVRTYIKNTLLLPWTLVLNELFEE